MKIKNKTGRRFGLKGERIQYAPEVTEAEIDSGIAQMFETIGTEHIANVPGAKPKRPYRRRKRIAPTVTKHFTEGTKEIFLKEKQFPNHISDPHTYYLTEGGIVDGSIFLMYRGAPSYDFPIFVFDKMPKGNHKNMNKGKDEEIKKAFKMFRAQHDKELLMKFALEGKHLVKVYEPYELERKFNLSLTFKLA